MRRSQWNLRDGGASAKVELTLGDSMAQKGQDQIGQLVTAVRTRIDTINREKAELVSALRELLAAAGAAQGGGDTGRGARTGPR